MATIVLDLDGTLIDTSPHLLAVTNSILADDNREPIGRSDLDHLVGKGARVMLTRAFGRRGRELSPSDLDELMGTFLDRYGATMPGGSQPYAGVVAALDRFTASGHTLAVCTNKFEALARSLLAGMELAERFTFIAGPDTFDVAKPDPGHIVRTVEAAGGTAANAVMVGDSINDIEAARSAGIPSIGVPYGYTDVPMAELGPDALVASFNEIDDALIARLLARGR